MEYLLNAGAYIDINFFIVQDRNIKSKTLAQYREKEARIQIVENIKQNLIDRFKETLRDEISEALFAVHGAPFFRWSHEKGTFGHHFVQTIVQYMMTDITQSPKPFDENWDGFLVQINSYQERKRTRSKFSESVS
jgi:hypothetical protein